ncbi:Equilibrative nucleotide transporter 5 [Camellia lanceoleosa]|uniref:Equilibrative nucleotide transporter 5 n=1 Tax=Camellia lanceoleosa TaxID=1840588 RepID=A0ACC0FPM6_9ERIC|nr:Equilibrative nucleotide transporter 5 [Camellia lanceoleosa]
MPSPLYSDLNGDATVATMTVLLRHHHLFIIVNIERINKMVILERDGSSYPVHVVEDGDLLVNSMEGGDHCSVTYHESRNEDDDVGNIVADVAKNHVMANSKQINDVIVGEGHDHACNSVSVSMVNETGVALGICNHVEANRVHNIGLQISLLQKVEGNGRRAVAVVETSNEPNRLMRSLSDKDLIQPNISLEVVLDAAQADRHSKGSKNDKETLAGEKSPSEEVGDSDDELSPSEDEGEVFQSGALLLQIYYFALAPVMFVTMSLCALLCLTLLALVLIAMYNVWNLMSSYIPLWESVKIKSRIGLMIATLSHFLLIPTFYFTAKYGGEGQMLMLTSFLRLTSGHLTICIFTEAPIGSSVYASAITNKLIEVVNRQDVAIPPTSSY